jgi:hypothetical protein
VEGLDAALRDLAASGLLVEVGDRRRAVFEVDEDVMVRWRRTLLEWDPQRVALLQAAGSRWAALVSTATNTDVSAARSMGSSLASATA